MGAGELATVSCQACGKSYRWKPEYAGRKVKCKCGQVMDMPAEPPPAPEEDLYDLAPDPTEEQRQRHAQKVQAAGTVCPSCEGEIPAGTMVCPECGHSLVTGTKVKKQSPTRRAGLAAAAAVPAVPVAAVAAMPAGGAAPAAPAKVLGYVGTGRKEQKEEGPSTFRDFQLPIILIVAGSALAGINGVFIEKASIGSVALMLGVRTLLDLFLIAAGLLAAVKLMDMSLGDVGQAALKVVAIALTPAALSDIMGGLWGMGGALFGWMLSLVLTYALFMILFEMDFTETMICAAIIWLIRQWLGMFILALIMGIFAGGGFGDDDDSGFGAPSRSSPRMVAPGGGGGGDATADDEEDAEDEE